MKYLVIVPLIGPGLMDLCGYIFAIKTKFNFGLEICVMKTINTTEVAIITYISMVIVLSVFSPIKVHFKHPAIHFCLGTFNIFLHTYMSTPKPQLSILKEIRDSLFQSHFE